MMWNQDKANKNTNLKSIIYEDTAQKLYSFRMPRIWLIHNLSAKFQIGSGPAIVYKEELTQIPS
jgi:hypothetical protein